MSREAMQIALEALESDPVSHAGLVNRKQAINALRQALAQPEQEPVAYETENELWWAHSGDINNWIRKNGVPLYRRQPQREWVGLTDEEIAQGLKESWVTEQAWQSAVWWAEAKLKEKNRD